MSDAGTRVKRTVKKKKMQSLFYLFVFLESHLKIKLELKKGCDEASCKSQLLSAGYNTDTNRLHLFGQLCAACSGSSLFDRRDLLWFSFWKNDSSRYAKKWINSPLANDFYTVH